MGFLVFFFFLFVCFLRQNRIITQFASKYITLSGFFVGSGEENHCSIKVEPQSIIKTFRKHFFFVYDYEIFFPYLLVYCIQTPL